jgi:hypothetical protein
MSYSNILSRRFLLKFAQDPEAENLLKKHLGDPSSFQNPVFEYLVQKGIVPIITPRKNDRDEEKETAHLGGGMYSEVYEVSYKGKLAVAKITESKKDFDIMLNLEALRSKLGKDAKHLPIILDKFTIPSGGEIFDPKYVIIVEKLVPLSPHLVDMLFGNNKTKFNVAKSNIDLVDATTKLIGQIKTTSGWNRINKDVQLKILELTESAFRKSILSAKDGWQFSSYIRQYIQKINDKFTNSPNYYDIENVIHKIHDYIREIVGHQQSFPYFARGLQDDSETANYFKESPEAKDFMKFLLRLRSEFGISWGDMHSNNIMVRPSTGDLIVSDSGYFEGAL